MPLPERVFSKACDRLGKYLGLILDLWFQMRKEFLYDCCSRHLHKF